MLGPMASRPPTNCGPNFAQLYPKQLADGHRAYRIVFELMGEEEAKATAKAGG